MHFSEIGNLAGLRLKLQFVSDKGDKFGSQEIAFCVVFGKIRRMSREKQQFIAMFMALMLFCLLSCSHYSRNRKPVQVPCREVGNRIHGQT